MTLKPVFDDLRKKNEAGLIIYTTAGFPTWSKFNENLSIIMDSGADLIEVGVPFSDPISDGPIIQYASQTALQNGVTLKKILEFIQKVKKHCPIILMSYLNPLFVYGKERIIHDVKQAGLSGLIIPDLPAEEAGSWGDHARSNGLDLVLLIAPTSSESRIRTICSHSRGFVYCVSVTGTTGVRQTLSSDLIPFIQRVKQCTQKPVAVGFGISGPEQICELSGYADGIILGSRIIEAVLRKENLRNLIREMKSATRFQKQEKVCSSK
jgi:tryptophan synthase alpha chain